MKFTPEFIQRVQEANNLVDIISQYSTLKPAGGGLMGRCPFPDHPEKTPSFSVSESKQVYNCFGCHKKGNIFTFLETYNGMSFPEAIEYLANRANIQMPAMDAEQSDKLDKIALKKRQILNVNRMAMQFFESQLTQAPAAHPVKQYIEKRKLSKEALATFHIGFASAEWDSLIQHLSKKGISIQLMEEAKLIKARTNGSGYFDLFRDRLMFPIFDTKNEVIAFGGRILGSGDVKYLNSPETLVFSKSKTLYGLSETSKYIRSEDQAIVVEGYMDLISLHQAGIKNVVAPMGTALTLDQSKALRRQTQSVMILFDGDSAGQNAAQKSLPILLSADLRAKGMTLPNGLDPDDFVRQFGSQSLVAEMQKAPELFSLVFDQFMTGYQGTASDKVRLIDELKPIFQAIVDTRLSELYQVEVAAKLGVDLRWVKSSLLDKPQAVSGVQKTHQVLVKIQNSANSTPKPQVQNTPQDSSLQPTKISLKGGSPAEETLLSLSLSDQDCFVSMLASNVLEEILHVGIKKVLEQAASLYRQNPSKFDTLASLLTSFVDDPKKLIWQEPELLRRSLNAESIDEENSSEWSEEERRVKEGNLKLIQDCVKRIRERHLKYKAFQISQELKANPVSQQQIDPNKLEQFMQLQRNRLALTAKGEASEANGILNDSSTGNKKEDDSEFK